MKRIGNSKEPTAKQLSYIALNLREKFDRTFFVHVDCNSYDHVFPIEVDTRFKVSILPGFDEECTQILYNNWPDLLQQYRSWMKTEVLYV